jgi:tellurium resistance protein TerZ
MAIRLEKGQRINLEKSNGSKLTNFCVGCNWGAITKKTFFGLGSKVVDVDLDLSCLMFDAEGTPIDHIYSPLYRFGDKNIGLPNGKLDSIDRALHHTGDDTEGDQNGDDGLDNEIITVDLSRVDAKVNQIVFFLNIYNNEDFQGDFSEIPYASIRMYEGTASKVREVFASYDVATKSNCVGMRALVMGKLYRRNGEWKFAAIGDAFEDKSIVHTIVRVMKDYSK